MVRRVLLFVMVFCSCSVIFAADAPATPAVNVTPIIDPAAQPWYVQVILLVLSTIITMFLIPYLKQHANAAKEEAQLHQIDKTKSLLDQRQALLDMLNAYLLDRAASIAEDKWPDLARRIAAGQITNKDQIGAELMSWGVGLRQEAIDFFKLQGWDIVQAFGVEAIDKMIELAANKTSPFPGKETAVAILEQNVAPLLVDKGVHWMQNYVLTHDASQPSAPPVVVS